MSGAVKPSLTPPPDLEANRELISELRYEKQRYTYRKVALLAWFFPFFLSTDSWLLFPMLGLCILANVWCLTVPRRTYRRLAQTLDTVDDLSLLPSLIESLVPRSELASAPLISPLTRLLYQVGPADGAYLSPKVRAILYRCLTPNLQRTDLLYNEDLAIAILHALTQIGDIEAIPAVRRLTQTKFYDPVVEAADSSLTILNACAERRKQHDTLLRAADATDHTERLVRVAGTTSSDSAMLLRVSTTDTDDTTPCNLYGSA